MSKSQRVRACWLGSTPYRAAWDLQAELVGAVRDGRAPDTRVATHQALARGKIKHVPVVRGDAAFAHRIKTHDFPVGHLGIKPVMFVIRPPLVGLGHAGLELLAVLNLLVLGGLGNDLHVDQE